MISPKLSESVTNNAPPPVELHYVRKSFINSGESTVALCGEPITPTTNTARMGNGTSYTCPDCMLRYLMLPEAG